MDKEIGFRFERDPEYRIVIANGAWGGITPRGELMFDLFFEHLEMPEEIYYMTTPEGLGPESRRVPDPLLIIREALVGVVMTPENAESLAHWILEHVRMYRAQQQSKNPPTPLN